MAVTQVELFPDALHVAGSSGVSTPIAVPDGTGYIGLRVQKKNWPDLGTDNVVRGRIELSDNAGATWHHVASFTDTGQVVTSRGGTTVEASGCGVRLPRFLRDRTLVVRARLQALADIEGAAAIVFDDRQPPVIPQLPNSVTYDNDSEITNFNSSTPGTPTSASSLTIGSFVVGNHANRYLIVGVGGWNDPAGAVDTVTFNGTGLTALVNATSADGKAFAEQYGLLAPAVTTGDVVVTMLGSYAELGITALSVYDVDQTTPTGVSSEGTGTTQTTALGTAVSAAQGDMVVDFVYYADGQAGTPPTWSAGAGQTERANTPIYHGAPWGCSWILSSTKAGAASVSPSWSNNSTSAHSWVTVATPIRMPVTREQEGFRFYADDAGESSSTPLAAQDTNITRAIGSAARLRMLVNVTGDPDSTKYQLEWKLSTDSTWRPVR
jgi:hypothetical protein